MADLRSYIFLDSLQPQVASFFATVSQGFLPIAGQASLFVEISPGMEINTVTDVALKSTKVTPGMQIIERLYGMLEIHSESQADVRQAGAAILAALNLKEEGRYKPVIYSNNVIRRIDDYHTMLINRTRHGNMILPGHTLFTLEVAPAAYAAFAANEAEKMSRFMRDMLTVAGLLAHSGDLSDARSASPSIQQPNGHQYCFVTVTYCSSGVYRSGHRPVALM